MIDFTITKDSRNPNFVQLKWTSNFKEEWNSVLQVVKQVPGRSFNSRTKSWAVPAKELPAISSRFPEMDTSQISEDCSTYEPIKEIDITTIPIEEAKVHPSARPYQVDFVRYMTHLNGRGLLGDDMGTGKTFQSLLWAQYSNDYPCIIVVLASTKIQWMRAWLQWHPVGHPQRHNIEILDGKAPRKLDPKCNYIINWDILATWTGTFKKGVRASLKGPLYEHPAKYIIGDEIQMIANPTSGRSRAFRALATKIHHFVGMSGTPILSYPKQFWPVLNLVDKELFPNYLKFLERYCDPKWGLYGTTYNGATNVQELHSLVKPLMLRRMKKDVMAYLPPKTIQVMPLNVPTTELNEYLKQEQEAFSSGGTEFELRQRVAHLMKSAYALKERAALEWIAEFLESGGGKLTVFCWHRAVVDLVVMTCKKYHPAQIDGSITGKKRDEQVEKFRTNPKCRLLVSNIQAGGVGLDGLQDACSHAAFLEFAHTPTAHSQAEDRFHRGGQEFPVNIYYLAAPGTVDDDALEVLDQRRTMLDSIMDGGSVGDGDMLKEILLRRGMGIQ